MVGGFEFTFRCFYKLGSLPVGVVDTSAVLFWVYIGNPSSWKLFPGE